MKLYLNSINDIFEKWKFSIVESYGFYNKYLVVM